MEWLFNRINEGYLSAGIRDCKLIIVNVMGNDVWILQWNRQNQIF